MQLPMRFMYTLTFLDTVIWRLDLEKFLDSISLKTLTIHLFQKVQQSSGDAGICHLEHGSVIMFTFH